jgi:zinc/manganese transport system substrate-binding protein
VPGAWALRGWLLPAVALLGSLLTACAQGTGVADRGRPDAPLVITTVLPMTLFTRAVAGDCARVEPLLPSNVGPHDVQMRPADLVTLRRADGLVKNGLGLEPFLEPLLRSAENPRLVVIDAGADVEPLATASAPERGPDPAPAHAHAHGADDGHDHGPVNPHVWLDPLRAAQQVEAIRDGLVRLDPACAAGYRRNAAATVARLRSLDRELAGQLAPFRGRSFVAFHAVAPYFAERYGLRADWVVDVPELSPSPADLQRVAALVKRSRLQGLLSEPQQGPSSFNALAGDLGLHIGVFDPLEAASEAEARDPDTYVRVMRRNALAVRRVFGAATAQPLNQPGRAS